MIKKLPRSCSAPNNSQSLLISSLQESFLGMPGIGATLGHKGRNICPSHLVQWHTSRGYKSANNGATFWNCKF